MARSQIPSGITRDDVLNALVAIENGTAQHEFHESERYDIIHEGKRYAPKAVLGVAAARVAGRVLLPREFSGGEHSGCFRILRKLGFVIEPKSGWQLGGIPTFEVGKEYNRREQIHAALGGQMQGGISTPSGHAVILLFTGDRGDAYGYRDEFRTDGVFLYTGEGQFGDMQLNKGNLAIKNSAQDGKQILLFEQTKRGHVRFNGYAKYLGHNFTDRPDCNGESRKAIVFELEIENTLQSSSAEIQAAGDTTTQKSSGRSLQQLRRAAMAVAPKTLVLKERVFHVRKRAQAIKKYVLCRANGLCEGCGSTAPFLTHKKQPYLEPHHTTRIADGGPDHPAHVIALCPTCHRKVHHGLGGDEYNIELIQRLSIIEGSQK
jgi:5-methylcytosine-specific restriction protein A